MKRILILGAACVALSCSMSAEAVALGRSVAMPLGRSTAAPTGYVVFCDSRPAECNQMRYADEPAPGRAIATYWSAVFHPPAPQQYSKKAPSFEKAQVPLTPATKALLARTNRQINRLIRPRADGVGSEGYDVWSLPLEEGRREGDCEDFVLEKRRALIRAGLPAAALSIAVVETGQASRHAVLIVATDEGELVLDSRSSWILPWQDVGYAWIMRQSPGDPDQWVELSGLSGRALRASYRRSRR